MTRDRTKTVLRTLCADARLEAKWLNTLSLLEFTGARKVSRTVARHHPSREVLEHLATGTEHALAFKELAHELVGGDPGAYLVEPAAKRYFSRLDVELSAWVGELIGVDNTLLNYLVVTTMVQHRALELYSRYRDATENEVVRERVRGIVATVEEQHETMRERCRALLSESGIRSLDAASAVESAYYADFLASLESALGIELRMAG